MTRYDRRAQPGEALVRVHQEDLCQALGVPPSRKYENEGGPGAAQIATLLREAMPPAVAERAVWQFADALAWNWLIGGTDAHAKNYSLLIAGDQIHLAPVYDIASALPYDVHERKLRFAMKLGGSYDVFLRRNPWPATADDLGLDIAALSDRVRDLADALPDAFADAIGAPDVVALARAMPSKLRDLVTARAATCRDLVATR